MTEEERLLQEMMARQNKFYGRFPYGSFAETSARPAVVTPRVSTPARTITNTVEQQKVLKDLAKSKSFRPSSPTTKWSTGAVSKVPSMAKLIPGLGAAATIYDAFRPSQLASAADATAYPGTDFRVTQAYPSMDNVYTDPTAMAYAGVTPPGEEFGSSYAGPNTMGLNRDYDRVKAMFDSPVDSASIAAPTDADVPSYETTAGDWVMNTGNPVTDRLRNIAGGGKTIDWGMHAQELGTAPQDYTVNMPTSNAALNDIMQARLSTMYGGAHHPATPTGTLGISGSVYEDPYTPGQLMWDDPNYASSVIGHRNMLPGFELTSGVPSGSVSIDAVSPHGDMVTSTDISEFRPDLYGHHRSDPVSRVASPFAELMDPVTTVTQGVVPFSQTLSGQTVPMSTVTKGTPYSPDFYKDISPIASPDITAQDTIAAYNAASMGEIASHPGQGGYIGDTERTIGEHLAAVNERVQARPAAVTPAPAAPAQPAGPSAADIERQKQAAINARLAQQATARQQEQQAAAARAQAASAAQAQAAQANARALLADAASRDRGGPSSREIAAAREVLSQVDTFGGGRITGDRNGGAAGALGGYRGDPVGREAAIGSRGGSRNGGGRGHGGGHHGR